MSTSPFLRNRQRILARQAGTAASTVTIAAPDETTSAGREYAGLRVLLHDNLRVLKDIDSHEQRIPKKVEFAKAFAAWIDGVIEADEPVQDEILTTNMIWAIDYADFDYAILLAGFAIKHGLAMPGDYKRSVACFLREDVAEIALGNPDAVDHSQLIAVDELTADDGMNDSAKAKLNKAIGRSWARMAENFDPADENAPAGGAASYAEQALAQFKRALNLDKKAGVKKDIQAAEKLLRDAKAAADA